MANTMRWRYGDTNPVMLPVPSDQAIEIGDLIYLDTGSAKSASAQPDQGTLQLNQSGFKSAFVGVAMQASAEGEVDPIRIATTGVFELDCDAATFELGDLLGAANNATGDGLADQKVVAVGSVSSAIGRCSKRCESASTRVLADVVSTVMRGGAQAVD